MFCKAGSRFWIKSIIFLSLTAFVYFTNFTEVLRKYEEGYTNIATSHEIMGNGMKPPFITICMLPRAKQSILDKYNVTIATLNEPNTNDKNTLTKLNKTVKDLFMEATFRLNIDFKLHMIWWTYDENGWIYHKHALVNNENIIQVHKH